MNDATVGIENLKVDVDGTASDAVTITARADVPLTLFRPFAVFTTLSSSAIPVRVVAKAELAQRTVRRTRQPPSGAGSACILLKDGVQDQAFLVNSGASLVAPDCEIHVRSRSDTSVRYNRGQNIQVRRVCTEGQARLENTTSGNSVVPPTQDNCTTAPDPFAGNLPPVPGDARYQDGSCSSATTLSGVQTLSPGCYGAINFQDSPDVTLEPGFYRITGWWNINGGHLRGDRVTLYLDHGSEFRINSSARVDLTPPITGSYAKILFYENENRFGYGQPFDINDSRVNIEGLIWMPSRRWQINTGSELRARRLTMVLHSLILNDIDWELESDPIHQVPLMHIAPSTIVQTVSETMIVPRLVK